jgi:hypothetical protein
VLGIQVSPEVSILSLSHRDFKTEIASYLIPSQIHQDFKTSEIVFFLILSLNPQVFKLEH